MKRKRETAETIQTVVRLLDKTTRVLQTVSFRIDVLAFGQKQAERRLGTLERTLLKKRKAK